MGHDVAHKVVKDYRTASTVANAVLMKCYAAQGFRLRPSEQLEWENRETARSDDTLHGGAALFHSGSQRHVHSFRFQVANVFRSYYGGLAGALASRLSRW
ncbi:hypothetical protein HRR83_002745 [Exophiala dermatitidis]|uniref:Uncharacterized protein n=1 Tax=Exophiala dermatitidis TaxID=5970 RepID=A0AAN6EZ02_EXODE|nr:hypothetical protein HRR74_003822 [Exophiala dermatitidis]KAJ4521964.1 hypothetical protein HRR73_003163 [Exophiala dermatitidis]KAJ4537525.1 hypothetical protein HRR76_005522 [Exophiala dermatitidis]KAJ4551810.1 hypothetical protein HRR77_003035 [Exophiala dermatitidis]KAJ4569545.1 hypothetical protein HRR79_004389 [Exophiala dermatitidis]